MKDARRNEGAFSRNPLLGGLIRPMARVEGEDHEKTKKTNKWRRVQDDNDDNEQVILLALKL